MFTRRYFLTSVLPSVALIPWFQPLVAESGLVELAPDVLPEHVRELDVAFCARDLANHAVTALNADGIDERHTPWSTFKIPNLIIALETGVAGSLEDVRRWDPERRRTEPHWPEDWKQDQTLRTAFQRSVPWYFQDIALKVGTNRYRSRLAEFGYGNLDIPDDSDSFWLGGPLRISPREQMMVISRIIGAKLRLSAQVRKNLREVSLIKTGAGYSLLGKTGSGPLKPGDIDGPFEGWFVGWIERFETPTVAFALYVLGPSYSAIRKARLEMALSLLVASGHLPDHWRTTF